MLRRLAAFAECQWRELEFAPDGARFAAVGRDALTIVRRTGDARKQARVLPAAATP